MNAEKLKFLRAKLDRARQIQAQGFGFLDLHIRGDAVRIPASDVELLAEAIDIIKGDIRIAETAPDRRPRRVVPSRFMQKSARPGPGLANPGA